MAIAFNRAREALEKIRRHRKRCLLIHYACQSLYDDREGLSPSVSSIVVKNFDNDQTVSFAAHLVAEKLHIDKADIVQRFAEIETTLLEDFYEFVKGHSGDLWIHWNMVNIHYGFETLAHRYYVLTGRNAPSIDVDNRINLAGVLQGIYGEDYVGIPHMQKLMEANGGPRRDFVLGKDEVELFRQGEYARLLASTSSKVRFFSEVVELALDRQLKTEKARLYVRAHRATDGLVAKLIGLAAAIYAIADLGGKAISYLSGHGGSP
ncbi:MAG: hypothetical protein QOH47_1329 [Sphingomonadales bacterium]|jgi:hypothetical protein|nr:hypothetical protein [Sphingomonadales bacterium]